MPLAVKDLIFRLAIADHNPATLNQGFLHGAGVAPVEWSVAQEPICTAEGSQLVFANGLILLAQGQLLSGQEPLDRGSGAEHPQLAELLVRYCRALPRLRYQALQTLLRVVRVYEGDPEAARQVMGERLLQPGDWQSFGTEPMQPTLQLAYPLEGQELTLTVSPAQVREEGEPVGSALVLAGAFEQSLAEGEALPQMEALLRGWTSRRELLLELLTQRFPLD